MRFKISPFSVHYHGGLLLIGRPLPPEPPKAVTLRDLLAARRKLGADLTIAVTGNSMGLGRSAKTIEAEISTLDAKIEMFTMGTKK